MRTTVFPGNLAPIVVDVDCKGVRHVDSFLWSLDASRMAPEEFARQTVDDLQLPQECVALIAASLREQLKVAQQLQKLIPKIFTDFYRSLEGSFSAGSTATIATKYSFFEIIRELQKYLP